ncbi:MULTISPECIES: hypothetical protein [unclassified Tolypothrix]|nr:MULTISPECIES: hypothetical protein [unclassified Tolypothrix]EKE99502.1 hypothetical protein FDUTEX481_09947 [Tolypothrix sp. PCC 7601]MBE9085967.1 hypothetical protein [Tolypothrix sp. LEGE 11397]UYD27380.1 hypothetical protein HGR01_04590 [Tolypothrix sp. PCC 7712]UYD36756.1 hypothetical protein HG267_14130 [Tolypothrix sp. PCC 7601]
MTPTGKTVFGQNTLFKSGYRRFDWGLGIRDWGLGDEGDKGDKGETPITHYPLPITHYQTPNAPCPMPNAPFPISSFLQMRSPACIWDDRYSRHNEPWLLSRIKIKSVNTTTSVV